MGSALSGKNELVIFWFRRDLRLNDNHGLYMALQSGLPVLGVFIFDTNILKKLSARDDARVSFIYSRIEEIKNKLEERGSTLQIFYSSPPEAFRKLMEDYNVVRVYANEDYEPYSIKRDNGIKEFLNSKGAYLLLYKDHVIYAANEIVRDNNEPYSVFTPYSKKWKAALRRDNIKMFASEMLLDGMIKTGPLSMPDLRKIGFIKSNVNIPSEEIPVDIISNYAETRNFPSSRSTSRLGIHLRFGTISIRELAVKAAELSEVFLNQLIWRDFYISVLFHFPHVVDNPFKAKYRFIRWRNNEEEFERWCHGQTGYPIVDAGMRELNQTGFMHNRVRMITAGLLSKQMLIDWRWGEAYFAEKLLDFELASNNGNWQWAAGTGCDAAPFFRIFNPETQQKKFDPQKEYIMKWVPEYGTNKYPDPVVDHKFGRERALQAYKAAYGEL
jgi:deoxyribodipyrimidine photo-lyase